MGRLRDDYQRDDDPREPKFSLNDFRRWMASQSQPTERKKSRLVGCYAESKINARRLANHITVEDGELDELARDFRKHGGIVKDVDRDNNVLIEVQSGTFHVPTFFVRVNQD